MRFLHVIRSANPEHGGTTEWVIRLGLEQVSAGDMVEVATLDDPADPWLREFPLPIHALGPVSTSYGYTPRLVPWLRDRSATCDVVLAHGLWQYTSFGVWRALAPLGRPYLIVPQGMLDPWFKERYPLKHLKKCLYWPWAEYRVLRDATAVLFTAEDERLLARRSFWPYRCRERIVNLGTVPPPELTTADRASFAATFPATVGKRVVLFFGRIHEKKGVDLLVPAFASAVAAAPSSERPWHLVLAGPVASDAYRRKIEHLIDRTGMADRVTWTGMVNGPLKWATISAADVFILPSHQENFGVAVAEALACGVPALISNKVNIWREILADEAGLAEADDLDGTRRLLDRWFALDEASRIRMRANAVRCFHARFNARDAAARLDATLKDLLS